jgi:hypothetical protein
MPAIDDIDGDPAIHGGTGTMRVRDARERGGYGSS